LAETQKAVQKSKRILMKSIISPDELNDAIQIIIVAPMTTRSRSYQTRVACCFEDRDAYIRLYHDVHPSFNALVADAIRAWVGKPVQAGFPSTSHDVSCQAGRRRRRETVIAAPSEIMLMVRDGRVAPGRIRSGSLAGMPRRHPGLWVNLDKVYCVGSDSRD